MPSDRPWSKFFWSDWESDERLRQCSLAAQGLWMRMLCICAKGEPTGYLAIAGNPLDASGVARSAGISTAEAETLMAELEAWGVFSRDRKRRIYSRRMVKDVKKSKTAEKNGRRGGNPSLSANRGKQTKNPGSDNPPDKGQDKTQRPEARGQSKEDPPNGGFKKNQAQGSRLPDGWRPCETDVAAAKREGLTDDQIRREAERFHDYWLAQPGQRGRKADWSATWRNWVRKFTEDRQHGANGAQPRAGRSKTASVTDVTADLVHGRKVE